MAQAVHLIIKTGRSSWPYCGRVTTAATGMVVDDRGRFGDYSDLSDGITCKWCRKRILGPTTAPTGERGDAGLQSLALRNCLALARAKMRNPNRPGGWEDVVRFCGAAGVAPDVLRAEPTGERVPSARWVDDDAEEATGSTLTLKVAACKSLDVEARIYKAAHHSWCWQVSVDWSIRAHGVHASPRAAQLAAEDALIAVRDEIARAVGR